MANVVLVSSILVVALLVGAGTAWPWEWLSGNEACAEPGAVREEAQGAVSVCVAGEGWRRVPTYAGLDDLRRATPRAAPNCTELAGQYRCDTSCKWLGVCLMDGSWFSTGSCGDDKICLENECVDKNNGTCSTKETVSCLTNGSFPSLEDCSQYYTCDTSDDMEGKLTPCAKEGTIFDACTGECDIELPSSEECPWANSNPCTGSGTFGVAPNNDRLYYVCAQGANGITQLWQKCTTGHFNLTSKSCDNRSVPGCHL